MDEITFNSDDEPIQVQAQEKWYEWIKASFSRSIPFADLMNVVHPKITVSETLDRMIIDMSAYVLAEHLDTIVIEETKVATFKSPTTWWDHFKYMHQDWWVIRRFCKKAEFDTFERKVKLKIEVDPVRLFPQAQVPTPSVLGRPFKAYTIKSSK